MAKFQKNANGSTKSSASRKGNSKKGGYRGNRGRKDDDRTRERETVTPENDPAWYARYPELLVAAGTFPYPNRPGMSLDFQGANGKQYTIPGVLALDWIPSVGASSKPTDPASILGAEMYARVRKAYSGTLRADAPDYIIYVMALDSVFAYIAWLKRLYRTLNAYTPDNYQLPNAVLSAMGLIQGEINNLRNDKMHLWSAINTLVLMSRRFTCPGSLDIINRHYWMSDNIYTDDATINSQFYLFNPAGFYKYGTKKDSNQQDVPSLLFVPAWQRQGATTVDKLFSYGKEMIDALSEWDDSYTINGYLQRAYEGTPGFVVEEIPLDAQLEPQYVPEVLMQIENSRGIPFANMISWKTNPNYSLDITQDVPSNSIVSDPTFTLSNTSAEYTNFVIDLQNFLSMRSNNPTALENVVASRLQSCFNATPVTGGGYNIHVKGATEIPVGWRYVDNTAVASVDRWTDYIPIAINTALSASATVQDYQDIIKLMNSYMNLAAFDWHPFFFVATSNGEAIPVGDVHNVTMVSKEQMDKLNRVCLFSEFNSFSMQ